MKWVAISYARGSSWPTSLASPALAVRFFTTAPPGKPQLVPSRCLINACWVKTYDDVDSFPGAWWDFLVTGKKNFLKEGVGGLEARGGAVFLAWAWVNMQNFCVQDGYSCGLGYPQLRKATFTARLGQSKFLVSWQLISLLTLRPVDHGVYIFPVSSWMCL